MTIPARALDTFDISTKESDTPTSSVWRIETPTVQQKQTGYPQITFLPGDKVSIDAGGCVRTGGLGLTWKRYVNPAGRLGIGGITKNSHTAARLQNAS